MNYFQYRQAVQNIYAQYRNIVAEAQMTFDQAMAEAFAMFMGSEEEDGPVELKEKRAFRD